MDFLRKGLYSFQNIHFPFFFLPFLLVLVLKLTVHFAQVQTKEVDACNMTLFKFVMIKIYFCYPHIVLM